MDGARLGERVSDVHKLANMVREVCEERNLVQRKLDDLRAAVGLLYAGQRVSAEYDNYVEAAIRRLDQECPNEDPALIRLYALLVLVKGDETTLEDVHDAWAVWRAATVPDHPALVPFDQLAPDVQELDRPYRDAIGRAAAETTEKA